jgi:hypothetical protein
MPHPRTHAARGEIQCPPLERLVRLLEQHSDQREPQISAAGGRSFLALRCSERPCGAAARVRGPCALLPAGGTETSKRKVLRKRARRASDRIPLIVVESLSSYRKMRSSIHRERTVDCEISDKDERAPKAVFDSPSRVFGSGVSSKKRELIALSLSFTFMFFFVFVFVFLSVPLNKSPNKHIQK